MQDFEKILKNIVRIGKITDVNPERARVRVEFADKAGLISREMPCIQPLAGVDKVYMLPSLDDVVLCVFLPNAIDVGFCLGSFYSDKVTPPAQDNNIFKVAFADGTRLEYDKSSHKLTADVKGDVEITSEKEINIKCQSANIEAEKVLVKSKDINLGQDGSGVVTEDCICAMTGLKHPMASKVVKGAI